jgi:hypothetical protein
VKLFHLSVDISNYAGNKLKSEILYFNRSYIKSSREFINIFSFSHGMPVHIKQISCKDRVFLI